MRRTSSSSSSLLLLALLASVAYAQTTQCGVCPGTPLSSDNDCLVRGTACDGGNGPPTCGNGDGCSDDASCFNKGVCVSGVCVNAGGAQLPWLTCSENDTSACDACFHVGAEPSIPGGTCLGDASGANCMIDSECTTCSCNTGTGYFEPCTVATTAAPSPTPTAEPSPSPTPSCDVCPGVRAEMHFTPTLLCRTNAIETYFEIHVIDDRDDACTTERDISLFVTFQLQSNPVTGVPIQRIEGNGCTLVNDTTIKCTVSAAVGGSVKRVDVSVFGDKPASDNDQVRLTHSVVDEDTTCGPRVTSTPYTSVPLCPACDVLVPSPITMPRVDNDTTCETFPLARTRVVYAFADTRPSTCGDVDLRFSFVVFNPNASLADTTDLNLTFDGAVADTGLILTGPAIVESIVRVAAATSLVVVVSFLAPTSALAPTTLAIRSIVVNNDDDPIRYVDKFDEVAHGPCVDCDECVARAEMRIDPPTLCVPGSLRWDIDIVVIDERDVLCAPETVLRTVFVSIALDTTPNAPLTIQTATGSCVRVNATTAACAYTSSGEGSDSILGYIFTEQPFYTDYARISYTLIEPDNSTSCTGVQTYDTPMPVTACPTETECNVCGLSTTLTYAGTYTTCTSTTRARTHVLYDFVDTRPVFCADGLRMFTFTVYDDDETEPSYLVDFDEPAITFDGVPTDSLQSLLNEATVLSSLLVTSGSSFQVDVSFLAPSDSFGPPNVQLFALVAEETAGACATSSNVVARPPCVRETRAVPAELAAYARARCRLASRAPLALDAPACGDGDEDTCLGTSAPSECVDANCCTYVEVPSL